MDNLKTESEAATGREASVVERLAIRGYDIRASHWHDAGAYGRCFYCRRYSDDIKCLDDLTI